MERKSGKKGGPDDAEPLPPVESAKPIPPSKITDELERAAAEAQAAPRFQPESEFDGHEVEQPSELLAEPTYVITDAPPAEIAPPPTPAGIKTVQVIPKVAAPTERRGRW